MAAELLVSLAFGSGLYLVYEGLTNPRTAASQRDLLRPLREFLARAGLHDVTPREFLIFSLLAGLSCGLVTQAALRWTIVSPLAGLLGGCLPFAYYSQRQHRRRAEHQAALADAVGQLRDGIRTGLSVQEALMGLARTGPEPLRPQFQALVRELRLTDFETAVSQMRDRMADPLMDVVGSTLVLNEQLGGRNVSQVLDRLATATRGQLRVEQEIRAYQAQNITATNVIAGIPIGLIIGLRLLNPSYLEAFSSGAGVLVLLGSILSIVVGYSAMRRFTRLPGEPRVLQ